jgi:17beta-estradiol 17-dehydrogenase / very-long-chain 3-oxoacyl-CoA reductase
MSSRILEAIPRGVLYALAGIGAIWLTVRLLGVFQGLANIFLLRGTDVRIPGSRLERSSADVVTGASDGLGKELATQLASKGFNLVLVSRTQSKLDQLAADLEAHNAALKTKTLAMDFRENNDQDYEELRNIIKGLDIAILVNNVGQSHSIPVPFLQTANQEMDSIIMINCLGTLKVTQVVAPLLVQRKKGLILTMGSMAGWSPIPYLATYSGSKAFLQFWSSALAQELKGSGVDVQLAIAFLVTGAMSKVRRPSLMIPTPKPFVRAVLGKVGSGTHNAVGYTYAPWWSHALLQLVTETTVGAGSRVAIWYNHVMHVEIRKRALRKAEREAKKA